MFRSREFSQRKFPENLLLLKSTHWPGHDHQHAPSKEQQMHNYHYGGKISIIRPPNKQNTSIDLIIFFVKKKHQCKTKRMLAIIKK